MPCSAGKLGDSPSKGGWGMRRVRISRLLTRHNQGDLRCMGSEDESSVLPRERMGD